MAANLAGPSAPYGGTYLIKDGKPVIVCYMADRDFIPVLNSTGPNRSKFTLEPGADYNSGLGGQWGWQLLPNIGSVPSVTNAMFVTPSVKWPASDPWVRATKSQAWLDYNFGVAQQSAPPFIVIGMFDDVTEDNGWVPCDTTLCTNRAVDYGNRTQDHDITGAISTNSLYNRVCQWIQGAPTYIPGGIIGDGVYIITNSYSKQFVCSPNFSRAALTSPVCKPCNGLPPATLMNISCFIIWATTFTGSSPWTAGLLWRHPI